MAIIGTLEELTEALQNPDSAGRMKLLQYLSNSGLDPTKTAQSMIAEAGMPGGVTPETVKMNPPVQDAGFSNMLNPMAPVTPQPPQDLSREANPMGIVNLANSSQILPGETGGMPDTGGTDILALLRGAGSLTPKEEPRQNIPQAPAPRGNNWSPLKIQKLETPLPGMPLSLAEILEGKRR